MATILMNEINQIFDISESNHFKCNPGLNYSKCAIRVKEITNSIFENFQGWLSTVPAPSTIVQISI